ncbi:hypothetical protein Mro03_52450 [Microbispora rosea subsp. rosea]|nr:hypothetical protein Mro03_52450 [Microbispora rosea subsp. rosea]
MLGYSIVEKLLGERVRRIEDRGPRISGRLQVGRPGSGRVHEKFLDAFTFTLDQLMCAGWIHVRLPAGADR